MAIVLGGDGEVWRRVLSGDEAAFADLFTRYHAPVFRHAARTLDPADADDAMAAAFFELWRKRSKVRLVEDSVLPWLLVTVGYLCRNSARSSKRYAATLQRLPRARDVDPAEGRNPASKDAMRGIGSHRHWIPCPASMVRSSR